MAMRYAGEDLGSALQRPGMTAAAAALDPDAVPVLCILALAADEVYATAAPGEPSCVRSQLQPATTECLRFVQPCFYIESVLL